MIELPRGARLLLEPADASGVARERSGDQLQRHVAAEALIAGAIDLAHPARAEPADDLVRPDPRPEQRRLRHALVPVCVSVESEPRSWNTTRCDPMRS